MWIILQPGNQQYAKLERNLTQKLTKINKSNKVFRIIDIYINYKKNLYIHFYIHFYIFKR